ncbi:unnamed protein product [Ilex paraguariensis]
MMEMMQNQLIASSKGDNKPQIPQITAGPTRHQFHSSSSKEKKIKEDDQDDSQDPMDFNDNEDMEMHLGAFHNLEGLDFEIIVKIGVSSEPKVSTKEFKIGVASGIAPKPKASPGLGFRTKSMKLVATLPLPIPFLLGLLRGLDDGASKARAALHPLSS